MGLGVLKSKFAALLVATLLLSNAVHFSVSQESTDGIHFLLVHGAFHGAWCWYKVTTMLAKAGFAATALDMTSNGRNKTIADTVTSLAELAEPLDDFLANFPGQVVLVGHSLGGATISYAMERHPEKICKAIFLASVMPLNNESALTSIPPGLFQNLVVAQAIFQNFANGPTAPPTSVSPNLTSLASLFYNQSPPQVTMDQGGGPSRKRNYASHNSVQKRVAEQIETLRREIPPNLATGSTTEAVVNDSINWIRRINQYIINAGEILGVLPLPPPAMPPLMALAAPSPSVVLALPPPMAPAAVPPPPGVDRATQTIPSNMYAFLMSNST